VEKLDILHEYDVANALKWDIDILVNNAAIGENGPISEIPIDLVRRTFDTNVFATLELTQRFVRKFVDKGQPASIVFVSSMVGLISPPLYGCYSATKHAIECIAETMSIELEPFNIKVKTINPGPFSTGFNQAMAETTFHWHDDSKHFTKEADIRALFNDLLQREYDPQMMIDAMIEIIPDDNGKFRNVVPSEIEDFVREWQAGRWDKQC
jgi:short-subunit dehydrogenase